MTTLVGRPQHRPLRMALWVAEWWKVHCYPQEGEPMSEHTTLGGGLTEVSIDPGKTTGVAFRGSLADWILSTPEVQGLVASAYQDIQVEWSALSHMTDEGMWQEAQARVVRGLLRDLTRYI